jgi:hypothetical protein
MRLRAAGTSLVLGGVLWLAGVVVLETLMESLEDDLPIGFRLLALTAGVAVAWGQWRLAADLTTRVGRVGARLGAIGAGAVGLGFGIGGFLGFSLSYFGLLFVVPLALILLGVGLIGTTDLDRWGRWIPFLAAAVAVITYGFHALARTIWDPSDVLWFIGMGLGWLLLGFATLTRSPRF